MLADLLTQRVLTLHGLATLSGLAIYVVASRIRQQRRHPSAAIAWVISLALMPYLALPLYLLFGSRKVVRGKWPHPAVEPLTALPSHTPAERFQHLAAAMNLPPAGPYKQLVIHQDGLAALEALRSVLRGATERLDVCTFLLGRDSLGQEVMDLLIQRARQGLQVRLLIDGVGTYLGGRPNLKPLSEAGVQVALFVSPFRSPLRGRTNLRNHRKMILADGQRLWTGGRNLAAEYFVGDATRSPPALPWIDLSFDFSGPLAAQAQTRFDQDWDFATLKKIRPTRPLNTPPAAYRASGAQLVASGPDQMDDTLYCLLVASCFTAQTRILAVTPYFLPGATLLMALTLAARRGVAVDLIVPRRSNHWLADIARPAALREMAASGARVWLTDTMIHAKAVVIDNELALVGSANLDERSLFVNYELMVAFFESADVHRFAQWMERQQDKATPYEARAPGLLREVGEGLVRWLAFQL